MTDSLNVKLLFQTLFTVCTLAMVWCHPEKHDDTLKMPAPQEGRPAQPHDHSARFDKNSIQQNQEHIMEHLEGVINKPESEMNEEELQFHYFKLHDYDNNNKLDGIEIINAMTHYHKGDKPDDQKEERMDDEELISVVDGIMEDEDSNKDGYIDYSEFVSAQRAQGDKGVDENDGKHKKDPATQEKVPKQAEPQAKEAKPTVFV